MRESGPAPAVSVTSGGPPPTLRSEPRRQPHYGLCVTCLTADAIFEGECFYCALDRLTAAPLAGPSVGEQ